ncbi:iron ABC transporter permease [Vagococcus sp. BWB3-3]|uniref:Iron ABC transporter permease n=1 Tax=Vagococcus allomyrinae TaxID=2794353 RepID=A0A940PEE0_9ENTE|nr:iron ABC transporter permease [Vagococcus allomyrinae]MBP1041976.1 iron ABC transporter permease [Vagococcus allomyrinae]
MTVAASNKKRWLLVGLFCLFLCVFSGSFFLGRFPIGVTEFCRAVMNHFQSPQATSDNQIDTILFNIRLPRIMMAALIGGGISVAGATYQALFQNPMVSQDILGASQGAAFGAALALFFSASYRMVITSSFIFGLLAVVVVLSLCRVLRAHSILNFVLVGMMIGSLFSSAVSYLKLIGDPTNTLPAITYWLMGSLSAIKMENVSFAAPLILGGMVPIFLLRWRLNVISLGDDVAQSLGVNIYVLRLILISCATLITATAVSVSGLIGWVGLVVPHFSRLILGSDHRWGIPGTALIGATFLVVVDDVARLLTTSEIPLGILTSFIGAPIFILLIAKNNRP